MDILKLKLEVEEARKSMKSMVEARNLEGAETLKNEIIEKEKLILMAEEIELEEKRNLQTQSKSEKRTANSEVDEFRSAVKFAIGNKLTEEERAMIKTEDNAAIIPKQFVNKLIEIKNGFGSLKKYCDIIPVSKLEGTIPVVDLDQNELEDILEGADIVDGTLVTTDVPFKCCKVGIKQNVPSETLDDAVVNVESLIKKNFAEISTKKENVKILKVINDGAKVVSGVTIAKFIDMIEKSIDSALPSVKSGLVTLVNVAAYVEIKNKKDKDGRALNLITTVGGVEMFNSKPIIQFEESCLKMTEGKTLVAFTLNFKEAVKYCDRKKITIKKWDDNDNDSKKMSILERFVPVSGSKRSIEKIEC